MFTGIIQDLGTIQAVTNSGTDVTITVATNQLGLADANIGDSIAVNGVCLTATTIKGNTYTADVSHETLQKTTLKNLRVGQTVNLEKALTLSTPLGGHLVSGHVDGVGSLGNKVLDGKSTRYYFHAPKELMKYIAPKGSITIQGISLTVNNVDDTNNIFDVAIIPHTEEKTNLGQLALGDEINLEIDLVARYINRFLVASSSDGELTLDTIMKAGF
ncbi:MAG: riboflavin synthase [Gammaproteobacteria bacterium]|nr:riboflavin synthase [Gammaproteobacteria bacterium]